MIPIVTSSMTMPATSSSSVPSSGIIGGVVSGVVAISAIAVMLYYKLQALQVAELREPRQMVLNL